ncbi:hypothetical protein CROQUDRAFT_101797 [Cronartium quercuum f. sp. fusiforme G11]|uniref:Uncharacterized protein n=1 Tax=Cronartium quercuum f. sp. fusiforme G11 TaxID=708437 RepID=A0A9P6N543_9BASI|nr:hypothetical protein CROQUDRAFT_101797 [Cronartium quercuum f. sp. fusiforme G11]
MDLDSEVGTQVSATAVPDPNHFLALPPAHTAISPEISALWRGLQRNFTDWKRAHSMNNVPEGDVALTSAQSNCRTLEQKIR